jgi:hypothetical protein
MYEVCKPCFSPHGGSRTGAGAQKRLKLQLQAWKVLPCAFGARLLSRICDDWSASSGNARRTLPRTARFQVQNKFSGYVQIDFQKISKNGPRIVPKLSKNLPRFSL